MRPVVFAWVAGLVAGLLLHSASATHGVIAAVVVVATSAAALSYGWSTTRRLNAGNPTPKEAPMTASPDRGFVVTLQHPVYGEQHVVVPLSKATTPEGATALAIARETSVRCAHKKTRRQTDAEYREELAWEARHKEDERRHQAHREAIELRRFGEDCAPEAPVATEVWAHTVDERGQPTGYVARRRGRTLGEVAEDIREAFQKLGRYRCEKCDEEHTASVAACIKCGARVSDFVYAFDDEGFSACFWTEHDGKKGHEVEWPAHTRFVACYAVTGGSEGHYVHVDAVLSCRVDGQAYRQGDPQHSVQLFCCKTFRGAAHAQAIAAKFAELLGA